MGFSAGAESSRFMFPLVRYSRLPLILDYLTFDESCQPVLAFQPNRGLNRLRCPETHCSTSAHTLTGNAGVNGELHIFSAAKERHTLSQPSAARGNQPPA